MIAEHSPRRKPCPAVITERRSGGGGHGTQRISHSAAYHAAHGASNTCHHAKAYTGAAEIARPLVLSGLFSDIKTTLLLIGVALNRALLRDPLRLDDGSLFLGLLIDDAYLLAELCLGDICVLTEVQFLELFILRLAVRLENG